MEDFTSCCRINGKEHFVRFCQTKIILEKDGQEDTCIALDHVLYCNLCDQGFELAYTELYDKSKLREKFLQILGESLSVRILYDAITSFLTEKKRPKRFLVMINPISGKRKGVQHYHKKVEPILRKCGIRHYVEISKRPKQSEEILRKYDLSQIDGILTVGGDGHFSDVANALLRVQPRNADRMNDPRSTLEPTDIPLGIIPTGSGNQIAEYLHGTKDKKTALLHCLLGNTMRTNSASLHEDGLCQWHSFLLLGFGLFGDMMKDCEKFRFMGPNRYKVIPLASLFRRRAVDVRVEFLPHQHPKMFKRLISMPAEQQNTKNVQRTRRCLSINDLDEDCWERENGQLFGIDTHPIAMKPKDDRLLPEFGGNSLKLILTKKCGLTKHIEQLTKVKEMQATCYDYDFIKQVDVAAFRVKLQNEAVVFQGQSQYLQTSYYINCDGEPVRLKTNEFEVRFHRKVISIFGTSGILTGL